MPSQERLLDEKETAEYFSITPSCLRKWRSEGQGPKFYRTGRLVRYKLNDLDESLETRAEGGILMRAVFNWGMNRENPLVFKDPTRGIVLDKNC
jgi:predicted DNA-binding transcriptional regulator AlpA